MAPLQEFLKQRNLLLIEKVSKGWSSEVFAVKNSKGKKLALKIEKEKSPREKMAERETENLRLANKHGIGPKLFDFDLEKRIILMEFIEGIPFGKWLFQNPFPKQLQACIDSLFEQAKTLDSIGLSHGQLAGKGANILVKQNSKPVIIDFEKASQKRRCNNFNQLKDFLFENPNGTAAKKVKEILNIQKAKN